MARPLNLSANPLRILLLLALLLLGALLVGFGVNQPPTHTIGSHSLPASVFMTAPDAGSQPAANTAVNQSTPATTRIVTGSGQGPAAVAPPAASESVPAALPAAPGCPVNPPPARTNIPASCSNP